MTLRTAQVLAFLACLARPAFSQQLEVLQQPNAPGAEASAVIGTPADSARIPAEGRKMLRLVQFEETPLVQVIRLLSEETGMKVIASADAGKAAYQRLSYGSDGD